MTCFKKSVIACLASYVLLSASPLQATETPYSTSLFGPLGLNTVPNARHDEAGTIRAFANTADPFIHGGVAVQLTPGLNVGLRQTGEISSINDEPLRFYPGIDLKLRLFEEDTYRPEISLGLLSAFGHRRTASEYISLSKRYRNLDFTGGMAWGRLGSAAHMKNPFAIFGNHFDQQRDLSSEEPNSSEDWFTGEDVGFFAGVEYFTPVKGLSAKADWGADRYIVEKTETDFDPPSPWSVGVNYKPTPWSDFGIGLIGGEKIMGQLSLHNPILNWPGETKKTSKTGLSHTKPVKMKRIQSASLQNIQGSAQRDGISITAQTKQGAQKSFDLNMKEKIESPYQIGRAARHALDRSAAEITEITIRPKVYGLEGPYISLNRRDLENALSPSRRGSSEEIWYSASFETAREDKSDIYEASTGTSRSFRLFFDQDISLTEEDSGILYRSSAVLSTTQQINKNLIFGSALRLNLTDNLDRINDIRPRALLPVRSNVDEFADNGLGLDQMYIGWTSTLRPNLYFAATAGYLEEMYGGLGGEILYRPFGKTYAIGAEAYQVFKRDPLQSLNSGLTGDSLLTGFINAYYELPNTQTTIKAQVGRYLAEDIGGTLTLQQNFQNGSRIEAFVTATDQADFDLFGSTTHLYSGLKVNLPIGNIPYIPEGSEIRLDTSQFGRDTGQRLEKPIDLYDLTETLSYRHLADHWSEILD